MVSFLISKKNNVSLAYLPIIRCLIFILWRSVRKTTIILGMKNYICGRLYAFKWSRSNDLWFKVKESFTLSTDDGHRVTTKTHIAFFS
jgi:hypothetical protein